MRYPAILAAAALSAATLFAVPAAAEEAASVAVKYADLDLSMSAGKAKLERRIDSAARSVCGMDQVRTGHLMPSTAARECYQQTKASVGQQVAQMIARDGTRG